MKTSFSLVIVWSLTLPAWGLQSRYDPSSRRPAQQRTSFTDFALKQINPTNTDYGCRIDQARKTILDDTLKEYNWWAAVTASMFVVLSLFVILHQHQEGRRRERIATRFITQAQNSLVDAQRQLQSMTARHDELVESLKRSAESTLPVRTATRSKEALANNAVKADFAQRDQSSGQPVPERGVMYAAQITALNKKILSLQQDIDAGRKREDAARDRERNLQRDIDRMRRQVPNDQAGATALGG